MAKSNSNESDGLNLGTDAWNVADGFAKLKVLRPLIFLNKYLKIAEFGYEDMDELNYYTDNQLKRRRVDGLKNALHSFKDLMEDTYFAIKGGDKKVIDKLFSRVMLCEEFVEKCYSIDEDGVDHSELFYINEHLFKKVLWILHEVKKELNPPLNNASLIFRPSEEVDLDKIMTEIVEGG